MSRPVDTWLFLLYVIHYRDLVDAPATTLTSWHLLVTFCSLHVALLMKLFEHKPFDARAVMGFGILNGISIGLLNLSLGFNSVGFYQVKSHLWTECVIHLSFIWFIIYPLFLRWHVKYEIVDHLSNKCSCSYLYNIIDFIFSWIIFNYETELSLFLSPESLNNKYIDCYTRWRNWQSSPVLFFWRPFSSGKSSGKSDTVVLLMYKTIFSMSQAEVFASIQFYSYYFVSRSLLGETFCNNWRNLL